MSELFKNDGKVENLFADTERDENMDLSQFLSGSSARPNFENDTTSKNDVSSVKPQTTAIPPVKSEPSKPTISEANMSPLARELEKQKTQSFGMEITKDEYEAGQEQKVRSYAENDERIQAMEKAESDSDFLLKQRAAVVPLKQYTDDKEYVQMVEEISRVKFHDDGTAYYDYEIDADGVRVVPSFIRLRTPNDPPFSKENDFLLMKREMENAERISNGEKPIPEDTPLTEVVENADDEESTGSINEEKRKVVKFIIDKTGLGSDFVLTEDERKKLAESNEIRLTQVEVLDIASIVTEKPERDSFTGNIHDHVLSGTKTTINFPASGFKADMTGLTYGEIGDISLDMETVNIDKYYKRLAIIYNSMKNISNGPFESFEDFLKNFAYTDIPLAIYGLYVSTFPEIQTISLRCGRNTCRKSFDWNFSTRNILRLEKSDEVMLNHMAELTSADPNEYDAIYKRAAVRNSKFIKLPYSGYIVELGIASAYEFLYNFIPVLNEDNFHQAFGDDLNAVYLNNVMLLTTVLSVRVPNKEHSGTYILCEGYKEILDAIYTIRPEEIKILAAISAKIQREYQVYFSFGSVTCPHCQNVTKDMELTMDDLVFQTYQRLLSTEIDLTSIQGL